MHVAFGPDLSTLNTNFFFSKLFARSWGPGYAPFVPQLLHAADKPKKEVSYDRLDSCTERDTTNGAGSAQYATSKQRVVEEEEEVVIHLYLRYMHGMCAQL